MKRTKFTQPEIDRKFSGIAFQLLKSGLECKNLTMQPQQFEKRCCVFEARKKGTQDDFEILKLSFREFLKENPELLLN